MRNASDAMHQLDSMIGDDHELRAMVAEEKNNLRIAELIHEMRTSASLTQHELAEMVGTKQSVIARLENSNYRGHSLTMLNRIATALRYRLVIDLMEASPETTEAVTV